MSDSFCIRERVRDADGHGGEEVALPVSSEVCGLNIGDAPGVDVARRNEPGLDEVADPLRCVGVPFAVVVHAASSSSLNRRRGLRYIVLLSTAEKTAK